ncbi:GGDEF domain-containing response regulator [Sulfuricurvum sp. IAE1]|uniref:two-component system response regulator n=1 Tax=Sulfuricurvum sp. IAE1 TaxID=2546102 RepID=UPI00140543FA|nr:GGDEF domain-containing response regulator [Sulfuricurvum sp. IAE1]
MRILIAEDDPVSRKLLQALLVKWGYEVVVACDGEEAWRYLQSEDTPKLAVIDWMMPGMDGVQICRKVRERKDGPYIYILLLTAKNQKEDIIRGIGAGADDYITKPFDSNELNARLRAGRRILDLQAELISTRESLRVQATHDPLTGLPNRLLFSDRLTQFLARAKRQSSSIAVMYLDLDRFKIINDTLGHNYGDILLQEVADRLSSCLRQSDTLARMGGDEFTVILTDIADSEDTSVVAKKIMNVLSAPVNLDGRDYFITASIGISIYPSDGIDAETLVKNADTAMYHSKELGRNKYSLYTESLHSTAMEMMILENSLRKGLENKEFLVHYQPSVEIYSGKILGAEALVRWEHPEYGMVQPAQFIQLAEETGLIDPLSEYVLNAACTANKRWQEMGLEPITMSVNISAKQFEQKKLLEMVQNALALSGLEPEYLVLELTESALMQDPTAAVDILLALKSMGVRISVDDFGTGYSSLSYLKRFPIDAVKIDRSFIKDITTNPDDAAIAGAVVAMAHSLKLTVIAEGVETLEQLEFLRTLKCDQMQGYFITPPVPSDDMIHIMKNVDYQFNVNKAA